MLREPGVFFGRNQAEELAVSAVAFLASEPDALGRFMALSGIGPQTLRRSARSPDFLAGVLDFLLGEEPLLIAFATHQGVSPEQIGTARRLLSETSQ
jgi:hypothetical protein